MPSHVPVSVRRSVLTPLDRDGRARAVERRLAQAIRLGVFAEGEQLPSEPVLAAQFGVATVTLREALVELRRHGLVETRRGRGGGSFVRASRIDAERQARERLAQYSADDLRDLLDYQVAIASEGAALAAARASAPDLARLESPVNAFAAAQSDDERRRADVRLHVELPSIGRSRRLTTSTMDLHAELGAFLWLTFGGERSQAAVAEHRAIVEAVVDGDHRQAATLAAAHATREMRELIGERVRVDARPQTTGAAAAVLDTAAAALEEVFDVIGTVHDEVRRLHQIAEQRAQPLLRTDLGPLGSLLRSGLDRLPIMAGLGMIFAPNALGDETRWIEWLWRNGDDPPEPLITTLDPAAPDFYDYEAAEWFYEPREHGTRWIAGPFVDHSATDAHIFTLTQPVLDGQGRFLGVAGADLTVDSMEAITRPALAAVPGRAALLNHRGRVIAANTSDDLPGTLHHPVADDSLGRDPRIPWIVVRPRSDG
ncbi:MAG TPA: GntR family transcriptional regulator [Solirubrobacteraceae bacterium]|nr:GntR family transcriptional regulator [Solirubrobacteraceae bacterium]